LSILAAAHRDGRIAVENANTPHRAAESTATRIIAWGKVGNGCSKTDVAKLHPRTEGGSDEEHAVGFGI
jgi:hypothetical protein